MLIKINDSWFVDASLVSCVMFNEEDTTISVFFFVGGAGGNRFKGPKSEVARIVRDVNSANEKAASAAREPRIKNRLRATT